MKKSADLAILAIGLYIFHQIILPVVLFDYLSLIDSLKYFTPIGPLTGDYYSGKEKFHAVLGGVINLALVGAMVFLIMTRGKKSAPTQGVTASDFGTPTSQQ
jgi:hypothetical protein